MLGDDTLITRDHLPDDFLEEVAESVPEAAAPVQEEQIPVTPDACSNLEELEMNAIRKALEANGGNVSAAARQLGISRNTLYRKMGRL